MITASNHIHVLQCTEDEWYQHVLREFPLAYFEVDTGITKAKLHESVTIYDDHPYIGVFFAGKPFIINDGHEGNCWFRERA
jgi:hypothetical protein